MPELPEVETVRRALKEELLTSEKIIENIDIRYGKIIRGITSEEFKANLINQKLQDIKRYGKYLFFQFDKYSIVSHLRMEGKYKYYPNVNDYKLTKHDHIIFYFNDESMLIYNDTRKFGTMELTLVNSEMDLPSVAKLAVEANDVDNLTVEYLQSKIKNPKKKIKEFLLDQTNIAGLGNIYVDEVLFKAKIHPEKEVGSISRAKFNLIIKSSIDILNEAIKNRGSTVKSFSITPEQEGNFQHSLNVYNRKGQECINCGTKIKKIKVGSRGTHYCPKCQRK